MANVPKIPWQAAFVAYCNGTPEEEIAQVFNIPFATLKQRMSFEGWHGLRSKLPLAVIPANGGESGLPARVEAKLQLIAENRQKNLGVFVELRDRLIEKLQAWKAGTLKVEKAFNNKGVIVTHEAAPGPGDWVNIATFAQTIAQGTYKALGDMAAQDKPGQDSPAGQVNTPQGPAITIILPGVVALPRQDRAVDDARAGQVIDVRPVVERLTEGDGALPGTTLDQPVTLPGGDGKPQ